MFKSKNLTLILTGILLFSLLLTIVGITLPISRKSDKIQEKGSQSMLAADAIAIAMGHYSSTSLRLLQEYPSESAAYRSLCGLLERTRQHYGFRDVYTVTRNNMGYFYVLDARYVQEDGSAHRAIGSDFSFERYGRQTQDLLDEICDGKSMGGFTQRSINDENGSYIVAAAPIMDGDKVLTMLCMDISLDDVQFHKLWFIDFRYVSWICGTICFVCAAALFLLHHKGSLNRLKEKGIIDEDPLQL